MSTFDVVAASYQEREKHRPPLEWASRYGAVAGFVAVFMSVVGLTKMFADRWIIVDVVTLAQVTFAGIAVFAGLMLAKRLEHLSMAALAAYAAIAGALGGALLALLAVLVWNFNVRHIFVALSRQLVKTLTLGFDVPTGALLLVVLAAGFALAGAFYHRLRRGWQRPILAVVSTVLFIGLFQELIQLLVNVDGALYEVRRFFFSFDGLTRNGALVFGAIALVVGIAWNPVRSGASERVAAMAPRSRKGLNWAFLLLGLLFLFSIPALAGDFVGQVFLMVALFTLMGYGLNLELGYCGLLDLGFVAFFAVGAYTVALLTGDHPYALADWTFWQALPLAVILAVVLGVIFGVPVLKVRGDYLAVATLGLGEIVRVVVLSDMAEPLLGGAQGLLNIPRPNMLGWELNDPVELFYVALVGCFIVLFVTWRLRGSRLGRAWMSIRDDEDVAKALGIDLVSCKLLAYGIGAGFCGVAGAIFAAMLGSIFPHSFQLLISINVLALIIIGGIGSLPGVVVGAAALIGVPELLREFGEFRFLFYGLVIVLMMRVRPQGLWPSQIYEREKQAEHELQEHVEEEVVHPDAEPGGPAPQPVGAAPAQPQERKPALDFLKVGDETGTGSALLHLKQVTKSFGGLSAVHELDMQIRPKTVHSLIGPNGAGKTTVFNCIMSFFPVTAGEIWFDGERIDNLEADKIAAAGISRTYQNIRLFKNMTVRENILVGMHLHTHSRWWGAVFNTSFTREDEQRALAETDDLLHFLRLDALADTIAVNLSYGQQRRLEIGRALATRPKLLLLDEPMAGMNPREASEMMSFILDVRDRFGVTILLIEHQMRVVMSISDYVTVLDHGEKISEGTPKEVQNDPKVIKAYLGAGAEDLIARGL